MNDTYSINSLDAGKYTIEIENYTLDYVNNLRTYNNYFEFTIDKPDNHQNIFVKQQHMLPKFKHVPTNQTGLYINIIPYNTKCKLYNDNYTLHLDSTYELITDLVPGTYYLSIGDQIKELYITKNQILTIHSLK